MSNEKIFLDFKSNTTFISSVFNLEREVLANYLPSFLCNIAFQALLATGYLMYQTKPRIPRVQRICALCFLLPSLTVILPIDNLLFIYWCYFYLMANSINEIFKNYSLVIVAFCLLNWFFIIFHLIFCTKLFLDMQWSKRTSFICHVVDEKWKNIDDRRRRVDPFEYPAHFSVILAITLRDIFLHIFGLIGTRNMGRCQQSQYFAETFASSGLRNVTYNPRNGFNIFMDNRKGNYASGFH